MVQNTIVRTHRVSVQFERIGAVSRSPLGMVGATFDDMADEGEQGTAPGNTGGGPAFPSVPNRGGDADLFAPRWLGFCFVVCG
jgi:hypothetical protein